jgi:protein-glutamine gamma-glutamyltransferase
VARTVALYVFPAFLIAVHWRRLESGGSGAVVAWVVLLALLPALVRPLWGRVLVGLVASILAARAAFGVSPLDARPFDGRHDFFGPVLTGFRRGILAFYDISVPFSPDEQPLMHGVIVLAVFGFCLALSLALAARRPLAGGLALLAGAAWPATLISGGGFIRGAVILATVLTLLAWAGRRPPRSFRPAVLAGGLLVLLALVATTSPAVAKEEFLSWKKWDPYDRPEDPVSVRYVWNANYGGIRFPKKKTTVIRVKAPPRAHYWRATVLEVFDGHRWIENLASIGSSDRPTELLSDPLLPAKARNRQAWNRADVTIEALRDRRLPGPSMPVAYDPQRIGQVEYGPGGVALKPSGLRRDDRYTVWSYSPRPTPSQLAESRPHSRLRNTKESSYLQLAPGAPVLPFGVPGREAQLRTLLANPTLGPRLRPYEPLYRQARAVVGRPRNPYAAVVALESWFRSRGDFAYDERPPVSRTVPPLVSFVIDHRRGYCQHYAGAMALMLRSLGIPARVAAGFTSGSYSKESKRWTVTDHDAHAWVEVWFEDWGWLPFDPTPGRGRLSGTYTIASQTFDSPTVADLIAQSFLGQPGLSLQLRGEFGESRLGGTGAGRDLPGDVGGGATTAERGASLLRLLALISLAVLGLIVIAKLVIRSLRYLRRDPRRVAAACRSELVDYLVDQRVDLPRSATLGELANRVSTEFAVPAGAFARAAGAARYAPPSRAAPAAEATRSEFRNLRRQLRRRLGAVQRARGVVSVRSLGLRD